MVEVVCDLCDGVFIAEAKDMKIKIVDNIEVTYFECSNCNHKYITTCIDDYIRKEQRLYLKLGRKNGKTETTLRKLKNMKTHSDRLKLKVQDKL